MHRFICSNPDHQQQVNTRHIKEEEVKRGTLENPSVTKDLKHVYKINFESTPARRENRMSSMDQKKELDININFVNEGKEESKIAPQKLVNRNLEGAAPAS